MFQYRLALVRLRAGDPERATARSRLMGREKLAWFRAARFPTVRHPFSRFPCAFINQLHTSIDRPLYFERN
jgi:hypothetical protein